MPPKPPVNNKKAKLYNSRAIRSENSEPAYKNGVLSLPEFLASREFEIRAFEQSQLNTKYASSTRVFQSLPRTLRRRTASHNVKRIPKRLRARALREMHKSAPETAPSKRACSRGRELHRLKMRKRLLMLASKIKELQGLPRVQGTSVKEKFRDLNTQLNHLRTNKTTKLNNKVGAFDRCSTNQLAHKPSGNIKYANRQREFTWLPNHVWHAKRFHMVKKWGFQIPLSPNQKCFRSTSRWANEGALAFDTSYYSELIVETKDMATVTSFLQSFTRYTSSIPDWFTRGDKAYNGWIYESERKLARGSVYVHPSHLILLRLHPNVYQSLFDAVMKWKPKEVQVHDCRFALASIELRGPLALHSLSQILHVDAAKGIVENWRAVSQCRDPGLIPGGTIFAFYVMDPRFWKRPVMAPKVKKQFSEFLLSKQKTIDADAMRSLLSQNSRNESYKNMYSIKQLGKEFTRHDLSSSHIHGSQKFPLSIQKSSVESWIVTMPWFWAQPLWSKLIQVKEVKAAGLRQEHQLNFENGRPTYPYDYPFLPEGYKEHLLASVAASLAREKLPLSKRTPLKATEGYLAFDADWYFLWKWHFGLHFVQEKSNQKAYNFGEFDSDKKRVLKTQEDLALVIEASRHSEKAKRIPIEEYNKRNSIHEQILSDSFVPDISNLPPLPVSLVNINVSEKGSLRDNARIYEHVAGPTIANLIGFVTSGSFNIRLGQCSGIGLIVAKHRNITRVLVRNVGGTSFYKASVELI